MIAVQYSELVAAAQEAHTLDILAADLLHALSIYALPEPLHNTGLKFAYSAQPLQLTVRAHGQALTSRFDHVWLVDDLPKPRLGGRIQFFAETAEREASPMLYEILFDTLGNARLGSSKFFGHGIRKDATDRLETFRRIALGIINAIHDNMDRVDGRADV